MPTENRPSNTENLPCPFCAGRVDPEGWLRGDGTRGPECESCGATAPTLSVWNSANPTTQPHPDPIAWMVDTAFWWTKEEAERDAAETGLPIVGLGPMAGHVEVERCEARLHEVASLCASVEQELDALRTQLVEALAFLDEAYKHDIGTQFKREIKAFYLSASAEPSALPDPLGCNACAHTECGRFDGPRQVECRAMADNACARPGASS